MSNLAEKQVFEFDLRITVLAFLKRVSAVRADSLLRARVQTSKANSTIVSDNGFPIRQPYVLHRADAYTGVAADTFVGVHFRPQDVNHSPLNGRATEKP